jgi:hypothetical protein
MCDAYYIPFYSISGKNMQFVIVSNLLRIMTLNEAVIILLKDGIDIALFL